MIEARSITKVYNRGKFNETSAVVDVSLKIKDKTVVALTGPSGCGKTTMLSMLSLILTPSSGEILYDNDSVLRSSDFWKTIFRRNNFGDDTFITVATCHFVADLNFTLFSNIYFCHLQNSRLEFVARSQFITF